MNRIGGPTGSTFSPTELLLLALLGVLLFGPRLPEITRYLAKGVDECRRGLGCLQHETDGTLAARMCVGVALVYFLGALAAVWCHLQGWGG
jgi:hypothetical protein